MKYLLAINSDPKTIKGQKKGFLTGILYLAPTNLSGYQVCPKASAGCKALCLNTAGRGIYDNIQKARIRRTKRFFEDRNNFMNDLHENISFLIRKACKLGLTPALRLNGTSDIAWEKISYEFEGIKYRNIMEAFPEIQFYDYTKILKRNIAKIDNYSLTFSLTEDNDSEAKEAFAKGMNVAVVMNTRRTQKKPKKWAGLNVIDGDEHDVRFLDKKNSIVALTAKGKARHDTFGFVRNHKSGEMKW